MLEDALDRERQKLGQDLAKRCEDYLYDRHMMMWLTLSDLMPHFQQTDGKLGSHKSKTAGDKNLHVYLPFALTFRSQTYQTKEASSDSLADIGSQYLNDFSICL